MVWSDQAWVVRFRIERRGYPIAKVLPCRVVNVLYLLREINAGMRGTRGGGRPLMARHRYMAANKY